MSIQRDEEGKFLPKPDSFNAKTIGVRLTQQDRATLEVIATEQDKSITQLAREILTDWVRDQRGEKKLTRRRAA